MTSLKPTIKRILKSMGYSISRRPAQQRPTFFDGILSGLSTQKSIIRIVQVGANDGVTNDPLNSFIMAKRGRIDAVLLEPNPEAFKKLNETYQGVEGVSLVNLAVGPVGELELYSIAPQFHDRYRKSGQNPLGVTSNDINHVIRHVHQNLRVDHAAARSMVERHLIACGPISDVIPTHWDSFDILQVDVEGADDAVIFNSAVDIYRPSAINFEHKHLGVQRRTALAEFLKRHSYELLEWSASDTIALRMV